MTLQTEQNIETVIAKAIRKLGLRKESDLSRYLPASGGDYHLHHFTMRKMKTQLPKALADMIQKFIINVDSPAVVRPKQRAPRGSRMRKEIMNLSRTDLQKILQLAVTADEKELIRKLRPKRDLKAIKRDLIASIKRHLVDHDLWTCYVDAVSNDGKEV